MHAESIHLFQGPPPLMGQRVLSVLVATQAIDAADTRASRATSIQRSALAEAKALLSIGPLGDLGSWILVPMIIKTRY